MLGRVVIELIKVNSCEDVFPRNVSLYFILAKCCQTKDL